MDDQAFQVAPHRPVERPLRLATGLVLFTYAATHFLAHSAGLLLLPAMEQARVILLWPWRTLPGQTLLVGAFVIHAGLGLWAFYRRRHLRMPAVEAWQLGLGLLIPLLLIQHGFAGVASEALTGVPFTYPRAIYQYWVRSPEVQLPRQILLLVFVWVHGCIGLHGWLRLKPAYRRRSSALGALALLIPVLALAGVVNAGWDVDRRLVAEADFAARFAAPSPGSPQAADRARLAALGEGLFNTWLLLLAGTAVLRRGRNWHERRGSAIRITYPNGRRAVVPRGFSVLEASRAAGIPHTAVCGGRGRCSTCRIRVAEGAESLPPPNAVERAVLARIKAPATVRLACQLRPTADLSISPLLHPRTTTGAVDFIMSHGGAQEVRIVAMFVDLRGSTALVATRLPFDALFIVDRYIQAVTDAIRRFGGHVTSIAGDGVMSIFGGEGNAAQAAAQALRAAAAMWASIDEVSREMKDELDQPLRFGIGIHTGLAVVGFVGGPGDRSLQFVGDTGNVAARLQEQAKELGATLVISEEALTLAIPAAADGLERRSVDIRGRTGSLAVVVVRRIGDLPLEHSAIDERGRR
jgi:adenylate cyclase